MSDASDSDNKESQSSSAGARPKRSGRSASSPVVDNPTEQTTPAPRSRGPLSPTKCFAACWGGKNPSSEEDKSPSSAEKESSSPRRASPEPTPSTSFPRSDSPEPTPSTSFPRSDSPEPTPSTSFPRRLAPHDPVVQFLRASDERDKTFILLFLRTETCYNLLPKCGKIITIDSNLTMKEGFKILLENKIHSAAIWDSKKCKFIGMLTMTDFVKVLKHYLNNIDIDKDSANLTEELIRTWKERPEQQRELVAALPTDSLLHAAKLLIENNLHRIPIIDEEGNCLFIMSKKKLLLYLYNTMIFLRKMDFMERTIEDLKDVLGAWDEDFTMGHFAVLGREAVDFFCEREISFLPILQTNGSLGDTITKRVLFGLEGKVLNRLDATVKQILEETKITEPTRTCYLQDTLHEVIYALLASRTRRVVIAASRTENPELKGVISTRDVLKYLVRLESETASVSGSSDEPLEGAVGGADY